MELEHLPGSDAWIYLAATGGGAGAQSLLWGVPGASSFMAGAQFPYSRHELEKLLGFLPEQFVSDRTAMDMAIAAYLRACTSCPPQRVPVGVGCTAAVATTRDLRGGYRAWTCVIGGYAPFGRVMLGHLHLPSIDRREHGRYLDQEIVHQLLCAVGNTGQVRSDEVIAQAVYDMPRFRAGGGRLPTPTGKLELLPGAFNPVHAGHVEVSSRDTIFQLSLKTPHKDPVSIVEALKRVAAINAAGHDALIEPEASTFLVKARRWPGSTLILGSDAFERMLDPKYGHPVEPMLQEFSDLGTSFRVGERNDDYVHDLIDRVPPELRYMFTRVTGLKHYRLSSSQLREAK